jgi:hypothetical protein
VIERGRHRLPGGVHEIHGAAGLALPGDDEARGGEVAGLAARGGEAGAVHERAVGDADHAGARVAPGRAERVELLQVDVREARLRREHAARGGVERLVHAHEAARQRPAPLERVLAAAQRERVERAVVRREQRHVDRDRRPLELRRVVGGEERRLALRRTPRAIPPLPRRHRSLALLDAAGIYAACI